MAMLLEHGHDGGAGGDAVVIILGLERFNMDYIGVTVVSEHDVLVAATGVDREAAYVVREELADGLYPDVKFIGSGAGKWTGNVVNG